MRTDGQTDRHDEDNGRFSQFCERAKKMQPRSQCQWITMKAFYNDS